MSDDPQEDQVPEEEGTPAEEAVSEEEPEGKPAARKARKPAARKAKDADGDDDDDGDDAPLSVEDLRTEMEDIGSRAKGAGLRPFRHMVRAYLDQTLDAVDGLLSALEGNKRKKGD